MQSSCARAIAIAAFRFPDSLPLSIQSVPGQGTQRECSAGSPIVAFSLFEWFLDMHIFLTLQNILSHGSCLFDLYMLLLLGERGSGSIVLNISLSPLFLTRSL